VDTGIEIELPNSATMEVTPACGVFILAHTLAGFTDQETQDKMMRPNRLVLLVCGEFERGDHVANVRIVERKTVPMRYMEKNVSGHRVIRGDPQSCEQR